MLDILLYTGNYVIYEKKHIYDRDLSRISKCNKSVISAQTDGYYTLVGKSHSTSMLV